MGALLSATVVVLGLHGGDCSHPLADVLFGLIYLVLLPSRLFSVLLFSVFPVRFRFEDFRSFSYLSLTFRGADLLRSPTPFILFFLSSIWWFPIWVLQPSS